MKQFLCLLFFSVSALFAGTTGKIAGRVVDATTREPLPHVNVIIVGTAMGAATDERGNFFILNVPVGTYTVQASMVGYGKKAVTNVRVMVDMTTTVDFDLQPVELQSEEVVVSAERPAIQQDLTSTRHTVDESVISALPVDNISQVVQLQAGVSGSHFRGGRFNESTFLIDGQQVKSPVNGYTGYTGGFATTLPQLTVSEIQVSTGGFEAEYGNAQSGIVNTITRTPGTKYAAKLRVRTSDIPGMEMEWKPNNYGSGQPDWKNYEAFVSTPQYVIGDFRVGAIASTDIAYQTKDFLPHEDFFREAYQGKIFLSFGKTKITLNGLRSWSRDDDYYHRYSYYGPLSEGYANDSYLRTVTETGVGTILERFIFVPDPQNYPAPTVRTVTDSIQFNNVKYGLVRDIYQSGMQEHISRPHNSSFNVGASLTHTLSPSSFIDIKISHFYNQFYEVVADVDDRNKDGDTNEGLRWQDNSSQRFSPLGYKDRGAEAGYWYFMGDEGWWFDQIARTYTLRADYSNQFDQYNLLKAGLEVNYNTGEVNKVTFESVTTQRFDVWSEDLVEFAVYVQDKIEVRDGFILNAGLRLDYYDPNGLSADVLFPENPLDLANPARRTGLTSADKAEPRWQLSPRIGISHPITERDKVHFYYGHFFQRPDLRYLYENISLDFRYTTNVDLGNPRLQPEKTVSYEIGWDHLWSDYIRMNITGYFKDITNLVAANDYVMAGGMDPFQAYSNQDYANVRGIELTLETMGVRWLGWMFNYSYAFANGRSSSVFRGNGEIVPRRLDPLDWDVRHRFNANIMLRSEGIVDEYIGSAELTFLVTVSSGLPYTTNTRDIFPLFALRNDGRLPWRKNVDVRFRKTWDFEMVEFSLLGEVRNLFNWINVDYIAGGREGIIQFEETGDPTGPYRIPTAWSRPRVVRVGLELQF